MLDARVKWAIFLTVVFLTSLPVMGIINMNMSKPVIEEPGVPTQHGDVADLSATPEPVRRMASRFQ